MSDATPKKAPAKRAPKVKAEAPAEVRTEDVATVTVEDEAGTVTTVDGRQVKGVVRQDGEVREAAVDPTPAEASDKPTGRADADA
jgi:hypothetical protein